MELVLSVKERIVFPGLLKTQGKFEDMVAREELIGKVKFSVKEIEELEIKQLDNGSISWKEEKAQDITIEVSDLELTFLTKCLKELSEQEKLPVDLITLWKKVIS